MQLREQLSSLQARCLSIEDQLAAAEEASTASQNRYLRLNADWENYRKRTVSASRCCRAPGKLQPVLTQTVPLQSAESTRSKEAAKSDVVKSLLPVVDSFELARGQLQPANAGEEKIDKAYQARGCAHARSTTA